MVEPIGKKSVYRTTQDDTTLVDLTKNFSASINSFKENVQSFMENPQLADDPRQLEQFKNAVLSLDQNSKQAIGIK